MTRRAVDTWTLAALGDADRVLLLGPGWDGVARALVEQGVVVAADREVTGIDVDVVDRDAADTWPAVAVALGAPRADLAHAVAAAERVVVTRMDVAAAGDPTSLVRTWPLAHRRDVLLDQDWLGAWTVDEGDHLDLPTRLTEALATSTTALASLADAAREARESAARSATQATQRAVGAEARATTTRQLTDRWVQRHDDLLAALREAAPPNGRPAVDAIAPTTPDTADGAGVLGRLRRAGRALTSDPAEAPTPPTLPAMRARGLGGDRGPGWRVATVGDSAAAWLGGWVEAIPLPPDALPLGGLVDALDGHLDVLVIGDVDEAHRADVTALAEEASAAGAPVVGIVAGGMPWRGFADLCDLVVTDVPDRAAPRQVALAPPVDPAVVNPIGFRSAAEGLVTLVTGPDRDLAEVHTALARLGAGATPVGAGTGRGVPSAPDARAAHLRRSLGVVDVPTAHTSHAHHARTLVGLAAAGVPVVAPGLPDAVADLLGPALSSTLREARLADLDDVTLRELTSVRQRRAALWDHTIEARWRRLAPALDLLAPRRPSVSAVVVTNRPGHLAHCAAELSRQSYRPLEVVLGLHGTAFARPDVDAFVARTGLPVTVVQVDGHRTLGEGLNLACRASSGEVIVKWDDDDHYGPDHVVDLVQALDYSGATIVGKGSEFVHLGPLDVTIRRFVGNAETGSRSLAGGTLALRREDLAAAGWWRRVPRGVDQSLLDDVTRAGGTIHRTHGFGFTLARRSEGHTWSIDVDYFLAGAQHQWRGLARGPAGLDDRVVPRTPR